MQLSALTSRLISSVSNLWIRLNNPQLKRAFQCDSHLTLAERYKLYRLALNSSRIAEIGSYVGASACCFGSSMASSKNDGSQGIFCIDTWMNDAMSEGGKDTWMQFCENTAPYKHYIIPLRGFSTDVTGELKQHLSCLDLLFIDGDHSYEGVKADWEAYKGFLTEGSTVVFHDIGWAEGVKRVVQEDVAPLISESGRLPNLWWGVLEKKP